MGKYDAQLGDLRNQLSGAKNVLVVLPAEVNTDKLAAALALFLSLNQAGKEVSIVSQEATTVSEANLYGIGQISNSLPKVGGGNLTITLEGVVASDGTVPALEKLDWYPNGANLNLVFHVLSGQRFEPARIIPSYQGSGISLIFCIGASTLDALGSIYQNSRDLFSGVTVVNIDNSPTNTQYGQINVIDSQANLSEMMTQILPALSLPVDSDTASNILTGIYAATSNLTQNVKPDTFMAVGQAMQSGGKVPTAAAPVNVVPAQVLPEALQEPEPQTPAQAYNQAGFPPLNQVFGFPVQPQPEPQQQQPEPAQSSPEERPMNEYAGSSSPEVQTPEPDWLTPKIYKGGNIH